MLKPIKAIKAIKIKVVKRIGSLSWVRRESRQEMCAQGSHKKTAPTSPGKGAQENP